MEAFTVPIQHPDGWDFSDVEAGSVLPTWRRDTSALRALFPGAAFARIDAKRAKKGPRTVVFLTYENQWAASGGIRAVARMLPDELIKAGETVVRVSPYHSQLVTAPDPSVLDLVDTCEVVFDGRPVEVTITLATEPGGREWVLFQAPGFFEADGGARKSDPYVFRGESKADRDGDGSKVLRDSLFAARAVPQILAALIRAGKLTSNLVVHAQDWEFAAVALTVKEAMLKGGALEDVSASVVLTIHNPFDHGLARANLRKITDRHGPEYWPPVNGDDRTTVLTHMMPLTDVPASTVSRRFAQEFTVDPLQTGHFAGHYQGILVQRGIIGIDNGLFMAPPALDPQMQRAVQEARQGDTKSILQIKQRARQGLLVALERYLNALRTAGDEDKPLFGALDGGDGRPLVDLPDDVPIFLMIGRLDPGQKGFDVFARVIETIKPGVGRYIISPLSPFAFAPDFRLHLNYLKYVAQGREGEVAVLPFRLDGDIFSRLQQGVTWSVWPSLYEPFGGVTEFYINGTPTIARATGGLVQQVVDYGVSPEDATGILYREDVPPSRARQEAQHREMQTTIDPVERQAVALYHEQVAALTRAIEAAADLYREDRPAYGRILANLPDMCNRLDWGRSVQAYRQWYDAACI